MDPIPVTPIPESYVNFAKAIGALADSHGIKTVMLPALSTRQGERNAHRFMTLLATLNLLGWAVTCGMEPNRIGYLQMTDAEAFESDTRWLCWRMMLLMWWPFRLGRLLRNLLKK